MESSQSTPTLSAAAPGASPLKSAHEPNLSAAGERGMAKITDAAVKYDRIRDRAAMESFQGRSLLYPEFQRQLRNAFNVNLTKAELEGLIPAFDKDLDGDIDGAEFLLAFLARGFKEKARRAQARRDRTAAINRKAADAAEAAELAARAKAKTKVSATYSGADLTSASLKMKEAAAAYDREKGLNLDGFAGSAMEPHVFSEQLKRVFNVRLTPMELGAVIATFDKDGDGTVGCAEFLIEFFRVGFEEKSRRRAVHRNAQDLAIANAAAKVREEAAAAEARASAVVTSSFSDREMASALDKLKAAAMKYDKNAPGNVGLEGFEGASMQPHVFKEQLRRVFNIKLTPGELGALMKHFDKDGDGDVNCTEFLIEFFKIGFEARADHVRKWRRIDREKAAEAQAKAAALLAAQEAKAKLQVSFDFEPADHTSGMQKLILAAAKYDRNAAGTVGLDAFSGSSMEPHVFKEQLRRVFNIKVTPGELGALMRHFDKDGDGDVNCSEFLVEFFKVGFAEKQRVIHAKAAADERLAAAEARRARTEAEASAAKNLLTVDYEFGPKALESALAKITKAAENYDRNAPGSVGLEGFSGSSMEPHVFKEQLRRVFNIKATPGELGALMSYFDKNGDGDVNCSEFLIEFFKRGHERRGVLWRKQRDLQESQNKAREDWSQAMLDAAEAKLFARTDPFTRGDLEDSLDQLIRVASTYDNRTIGPGGLKGFEGASMTPSIFREQLRRTWNIKLNPSQLGSLVAFFDLDGDGTVDCAEFLTQFFKTSLYAKAVAEKKGAKAALMKLRDGLIENSKGAALRAQIGLPYVAPPPFGKSKASREAGATARAASPGRGGRRLKPLKAGARAPPPATEKEKEKRRMKKATLGVGKVLDLTTWTGAGAAAAGWPELSLAVVPKAVYEMSHLTELWLSNNRGLGDAAGGLGESLGDLLNLKVLGLDGCGLAALPTAVGALKHLRRFYAARNRLTTLPTTFQNLRLLEECSVADNGLQEVPAPLCGLRQLRLLDLSGNDIAALPGAFKELTALIELRLEGNPIATGGDGVVQRLPKLVGRKEQAGLEVALEAMLRMKARARGRRRELEEAGVL